MILDYIWLSILPKFFNRKAGYYANKDGNISRGSDKKL